MRRPSNYLSGRTKVTSPSDVSADRHSFLSLGEAEPNLGVPSATEAIVLSDTSGIRSFVNLSSDFDVVNSEIKLVANTSTFAVAANTTLQAVTDAGNTTTNNITLSGSNLIFDNGSFKTTISENGTLTNNREINFPDANGKVITTGNLSDIGDSLGNVIYGNDAVVESSYDYIVHTSANATQKLTPADALAGLILVDEAVDASQNFDYNLLMIQTEGLAQAAGSTTAARAIMVDNGGVTFNPNTNLVKTSGGYVAQNINYFPAISTPSTNQSLKLFANGTGDIQILKLAKFGNSIIVLDEDENGLIFDTNNDSGSVIHYNTAANTAAADIQSGVEYQIITAGTTSFTSIGAPDNNRGTIFTATGAGTGTGLAVTTSTVKQAFFGWDRSDNKFKWIPDGTLTGTGSINTTFAGDVGDAEFANLTLTGDLTVQGNTVTVNAETLSIEDPLIFIGTANNSTDDGKDRGIVFNYNDGTDPQTGFIGYDNSADQFLLIKKLNSVSNDVISFNNNANDLGKLVVGEIESHGYSIIGGQVTSGTASFFGSGTTGRQRIQMMVGVGFSAPYDTGSGSGNLIGNFRQNGTAVKDLKVQSEDGQAILFDDTNKKINLYANNSVFLSGNTTFVEIPNKLLVTNTSGAFSGTQGGGAAHFLGSVSVDSTFYTSGQARLNDSNSGPATWMGSQTQGHIRIDGGGQGPLYVKAYHGNFGNGSAFEPGLDLLVENLTHGTNGIRIDKDGTVSIDQTLITTALSSNTAGLAIEGQTFPGSVGSTGQVLLVANSATGALAWGNAPTSGITELLDDTSPELGGNLDVNDKNIIFGDSSGPDNVLSFGASGDLLIYHMPDNSFITHDNSDGELYITNARSNRDVIIRADSGNGITVANYIVADGSTGRAELYYQDGTAFIGKKLETANTGVNVTGNIVTTGAMNDFAGVVVGNQTISRPNGQLDIIAGGGQTTRNLLRLTNSAGATLYGGSASTSAPTRNNYGITLDGGDGDVDVTGDVNVTGVLTATAKSFLIDHPTKEGMKLKYGSLEGPENGVYVRGHLVGTNGEIKLPDYWEGLVDKETITVNITPIGRHQKLYVKDIINNTVFIGNENLLNKQINCYYTIYGERKDIDKLVVEYDAK